MVDGMKGGMASSKVSGIYHPHTSLFQSSSCNFHPSMDVVPMANGISGWYSGHHHMLSSMMMQPNSLSICRYICLYNELRPGHTYWCLPTWLSAKPNYPSYTRAHPKVLSPWALGKYSFPMEHPRLIDW